MIDYILLAKSVEQYSPTYTTIEVPWWVDKDVVLHTAPEGSTLFEMPYNGLYMVASAEQSFLQLLKNGALNFGRYQAITPCFRDDIPDWLHHIYFMKNELISINPTNVNSDLNDMIDHASSFFSKILVDDAVHVIETEDSRSIISFDIVTDDIIELGSYGIRTYGPHTYVYGTGCAEPRLSTLLKSSSVNP